MTIPSECDEARYHIVTEEQRERLLAARRSGQQCAACGRQLTAGETVWFERFMGRVGRRRVYYWASVGVECVSSQLLAETQGQEPQVCAWCGRGVQYPPEGRMMGHPRKRTVCSRHCAMSHTAANRRKRATGEG
jgi:hypothetical protein